MKSCLVPEMCVVIVSASEMDCVEGHLQSEEIPLPKIEAHHLKFVIQMAHDHFVSIHKLQVEGEPLHG